MMRAEDIRVDIIYRRHWDLRPNAVKITHLPSGKEFISEDQRSEHANKNMCYHMLREFLRTWEPMTIEEEFDALPEETKQKFNDLVSDTLKGFVPAGDDPDVIHRHAVEAYKLFKELK